MVSGAPAAPAAGVNPNPFYRVHDPGAPVVARGVALASAPGRGGVLTDIRTERNGRVVLTA
jgi:hypothetical protein